MLLAEFDQELHDKVTFEAGYAKGYAEGYAEGYAKGYAEGLYMGKITKYAKLINDGLITLDNALSLTGLSKEDFIQQALLFHVPITR